MRSANCLASASSVGRGIALARGVALARGLRLSRSLLRSWTSAVFWSSLLGGSPPPFGGSRSAITISSLCGIAGDEIGSADGLDAGRNGQVWVAVASERSSCTIEDRRLQGGRRGFRSRLRRKNATLDVGGPSDRY